MPAARGNKQASGEVARRRWTWWGTRPAWRAACASLLAVVLSIPLAGCGTVDPGDAPNEPAPIAFEQFCGKFVETTCDILMPCCMAGGFHLDVASRQSRFMSDCTTRFLQPKEDTSWSAKNAGR